MAAYLAILEILAVLVFQILIIKYNFGMLKFLDQPYHQHPKKSSLNFKPEMVYGISIEAPQEFQTPHTIVHPATYLNPYLEFEQQRESKIGDQSLVRPHWIKKTNLSLVQEQKILSSHIPACDSPPSRFRSSYQDEFDRSSVRFRITRGQFTNFIEKNSQYKSMGPIHGKERSADRIVETKKTVWLKPNVQTGGKMMYNTYFSLKKEKSLKDGLSIRNDNICENSKLLTEKGRIRTNRKKMNIDFQKGLDERRNGMHFNKTELPKMLIKNEVAKVRSTHNETEHNEIKDIEEFQSKLHRQFR